MKITVLYNHVENLPFGKPEEILADEDTVTTAQAVAVALASFGHNVELFEIDEKTIAGLPEINTDFFFNLAEGIANLPNTEYQVVEVLEKIGKPFSGSSSKALKLTTNKGDTKKLLLKNRLTTPNFQVISPGEKLKADFNFPVVVKPVAKDGSVGINGHSVLNNKAEIYDQADFITSAYQEPALVEEYIDGRELNVTVLGSGQQAKILPVSEIVFGPSFKDKYKIVDFPAKWEEDSLAYRETIGVCPAVLGKETQQKIEEMALAAAELTGCRNYSRVDFRLSPEKIPYILEVNANPGIAPDSGVIRSAKAAGYNYASFLEELVNLA